MKNEQTLNNESILKIYRKAIFDFEKNIEQIYERNNITIYKGYLINLNDYENLKEQIDYNYFKDNISNYILDKKILSESEKLFEIKQICFKTYSYLLNMIYNDNKYIIINKELWNIICEKGKEKDSSIEYYIKFGKIILELEDKKKLTFNQNKKLKNIIDKIGYNYEYDSNIYKIKIIYRDIIQYYEFEKKFLNDLKKSKIDNKTTNEYYL